MKHTLIRFGISVGIVFLPLVALAANVNLSVTVPLSVSGSVKNYTASGNLTSVTIGSSDISVTIAAGESFSLTSPDTTLVTFPSSGIPAFTETCGSTYSVNFSNGTGGATKTFTISPSTQTCNGGGGGGAGSGGSGGSSSGGGGGGGGSYTPAPAPATTTAPVVTSIPAPAPQTTFGITSDLGVGSEGNEVSQLQTYLATASDIYPEGKITGYFGPATERAVRRFQKQYGLSVVGRVGPLTRAKLSEVFGGAAAPVSTPAPTTPSTAPVVAALNRTLRVGSTGDDVSTLQSFLAKDPELYPEGKVTGYFGPATKRAVQRFQQKYGIEALGVVGPATRAKLNELLGAVSAQTPPPAQTSSTPSAADQAQIEALQAQLKALQNQLKTVQGQ